MSDLAAIITAIATLVTALALLASTLLNAHRIKTVDTKIDEVHTEVKTANSLTIAQLADNTETRRIDKIPASRQTKEEKTHLAEVPK